MKKHDLLTKHSIFLACLYFFKIPKTFNEVMLGKEIFECLLADRGVPSAPYPDFK